MLRTPLCDLLRIEYPIVQAPIGSCTCPELAAAVSNAGALGTLSITWRTLDEARALIRRTRELTARPFAANIVLTIDPRPLLDVCAAEGVPIVSFFWGDIAPYARELTARGMTVMATAGDAADATRQVDHGAAVIVAQGWEAGGHIRGTVATMPLVPAVVDAVAPTPVVAAGGIGDGRGLAAALALGAQGVWLGTRFVMSDEAAAALEYREAIARATEADTTYGVVFDGGWPDAPHRALVNSTVRRWREAGEPATGRRPGEGDIVAWRADGTPVARYSDTPPLRGMRGDLEALALYAGQSAGVISRPRPAAEIVLEIVREAAESLRRAQALVDR